MEQSTLGVSKFLEHEVRTSKLDPFKKMPTFKLYPAVLNEWYWDTDTPRIN